MIKGSNYILWCIFPDLHKHPKGPNRFSFEPPSILVDLIYVIRISAFYRLKLTPLATLQLITKKKYGICQKPFSHLLNYLHHEVFTDFLTDTTVNHTKGD